MVEIKEPNRDFKPSLSKEIKVSINYNVKGVEVHRELEKIEVEGWQYK